MTVAVEEKKPAKIVIREIAAKNYEDAWEAKKRGEMIGWCSSNFPQEIPETLGLKVVFPENQAAAIGAMHGSGEMCDHAEGVLGYSSDLCAYARVNLAYADILKTPNGEKEVPAPDFLLCCSNICSCMIKWYENLSQMLDIPLIMIDIPFNNQFDVDEKETEYIRTQFYEAVRQLEELTGKKWDEDRFHEVMATAQRTSKAWLKAASYTGYKPSPLNGFDLFNHMAAALVARCHDETADAFEQLAEEYEDFVREHKSTYKVEEKHRILFEGIACWPYLRATSTPLKEANINVTATPYAVATAVIYNDIDELMQAYASVPNAISLERAVKLREDCCVDGKAEGALVHVNRSCKLWSGIAPEMGRRIEEDLKIPVTLFDGDQADPRNFSEEQYNTRVQGLAEIMQSNKERAV